MISPSIMFTIKIPIKTKNSCNQCIWNHTTDPKFKPGAHSNFTSRKNKSYKKVNWRSNFRLFEVMIWISTDNLKTPNVYNSFFTDGFAYLNAHTRHNSLLKFSFWNQERWKLKLTKEQFLILGNWGISTIIIVYTHITWKYGKA